MHTDTYGTNSNRMRTLTTNAGMIYDFKENSVGMKYEFIRSLPDDYIAHNMTETNASAFNSIATDYNKQANAYSHHINAYLAIKPWEKATLTVDGDYIINGSSSFGKLLENSGNTSVSSVNTNSDGSYYIAAGRTDLETALWKGTLDAGIQYSYTRNRQGFFQEATGETPDLQPGENRETQHLTALYLSYKHAIGAYWNWKVGVRYEMADFTYFLNGKKIDTQSKTFKDMLPHAMIGYYRDGLSISLGYTTSISRPGYTMLGSDYTYVSHTLWETGNPLLRSSRSHDITLDLSWRGWMLNLDFYRNERNVQMIYTYHPEQRINVSTYYNMPSYNGLTAMLYKEFAVSFWHPTLTAYLMLQNLKYGTPSQHYNKPMAQLSLNNRFDLPWKIYAYLTGTWLTRGHSVVSEWGGAAMISLTLSKSFGEHWSLNFNATDIAHSWRQKNTVNTNGVNYNYLITGGSRGISLSVMYRFNKAKHTYKGQSAAKDELKRLK